MFIITFLIYVCFLGIDLNYYHFHILPKPLDNLYFVTSKTIDVV